MDPDRLELVSPLTPAECAARISATMEPDRIFLPWEGDKPVIGSVSPTQLELRRRISYRNSFQRRLKATLEPHGEGTIIRGEFGLHPFVRWFMMLWLGMVGVGAVTALVFALNATFSGRAVAWLSLLPVFGMPLVGLLVFWGGRRLAREEAAFLCNYLRQTLQAEGR